MRTMILLLTVFSNWAWAYKFNSFQGEAFSETLATGLSKLYQGDLALPTAQLHQRFLELPRRSEADLDDLVEAQFGILHYQDQLMRAAAKYAWIYPDKYLKLIQNLRESKAYLSADRFKKLLENYPRRKSVNEDQQMRHELTKLVWQQGNPALIPLAQNFGLKLDLHTTARRFFGELPKDLDEWDEEDFAQLDEEMGLDDEDRPGRWWKDYSGEHYHFNADYSGLWYRNVYFQTGDILGTRLNFPDDGLFSSFSLPRKYFGHAGVFAIIKVKRQWVPMVLEATGKTIAAVPLRYYLSPEKSRYVEVYRYNKPLPKYFFSRIRDVAKELIVRPRAYNLAGPQGYPFFLTCIEVAKLMYEKLGIKVLAGTSRWISDVAKENFRSLGMEVDLFLTPTDLVLDQSFRPTDIVDNSSLTSLIQAHLITDRLGHIASTYHLKPQINLSNEFLGSFMLSLHTWALECMKEGTPVFSSIFFFLSDIDRELLPGGLPFFVSFVNSLSLASTAIGLWAQEELWPIVDQKIDQRIFSFHALKDHKRINSIVEELTSSYRAGFKDE